MIKMEEARAIVLANLPPGSEIKGEFDNDGVFLFLAPFPDEAEGSFLPFFSVDAETGTFQDFDPTEYDNSGELITILLSSTERR